MISLYSGTPGSGKSLHCAYKMIDFIKMGKTVIANFPIDETYFYKHGKKPKRYGDFIYLNALELTPQYLIDYAQKHHKLGKEGQTMVVIDECSLMFNSRDWKMQDRMSWIRFFQLHRHFGFDVILICQHDRMLDRQIRAFIETEYKHRNAKNYKIFGFILHLLTGGFFVCIEEWYGCRLRCGSEFFFLNRKKASIYNSHLLFESPVSTEAGAGGTPADGETPKKIKLAKKKEPSEAEQAADAPPVTASEDFQQDEQTADPPHAD